MFKNSLLDIKLLILPLMLCFFLGCKRLVQRNVNTVDFFESCSSYSDTLTYRIQAHDLFRVKLPKYWDVDNVLKQGVDISTRTFSGDEYRGFMMTILPYQDYYFKRNESVEYYYYQIGEFNGYKSIFYKRNDLSFDDSNGTVLWRGELKIVCKRGDYIYWLIFNKRAPKNEEPNWCEFEEVVSSLEIIE